MVVALFGLFLISSPGMGWGDRQKGRGSAAQECGDGSEASLEPGQAPWRRGW